MAKEPPCVRCNRLKNTHPSLACLNYDPPAPAWMVATNRALGAINRKLS